MVEVGAWSRRTREKAEKAERGVFMRRGLGHGGRKESSAEIALSFVWRIKGGAQGAHETPGSPEKRKTQKKNGWAGRQREEHRRRWEKA